MKKQLAVTQIIFGIVAAILPNIDGMFTWISYNMFENLSKSAMSLNNLMTTQQIGAGPALFPLFYIVLGVALLCYVLQLFVEHEIWQKKGWISLPIITFLINAIMIITASNHKDTYTYNGEMRNVAVTLGIMGYVELILLVSIVIIEAYKQYKLCDECYKF